MGGDAVFGDVMHFPGANLDFNGLPPRPDNRRVQRLVVIGLGHSDIVFEAVRQGLPQAVDDAQNTVAVLDVVDDDPDGEEVVDWLKSRLSFFIFL